MSDIGQLLDNYNFELEAAVNFSKDERESFRRGFIACLLATATLHDKRHCVSVRGEYVPVAEIINAITTLHVWRQVA